MKNPFLFGPLVSGDAFYDRAEIERDLLRAVGNGTNVLLYGPRRYGKSSLVARVLETLRAEGHPCIYFDMMKVDSMEQFLQAYASAAFALQDRATRNLGSLARFFRGLRPKFTVGEDGKPALELDFASPPTTATLEDVLALPESLHRGGRNVVVVFDEFQEIERLSSVLPAERVFRSMIQRQKRVNYIYLGSRTHLIRRMFTDAAKPFYQSALVLRMVKPPRGESIDFLRDRFRQGGIAADDAALDAIVDAAENIPYYLQALAYEAFEQAEAEGSRSIGEADVPPALARAVGRMQDAFEASVENLSENQRTLLSALAREPATGFDADYRARHRLPVYTSVTSALKVLVAKGLVETEGKTHRVASPFFAVWLREPVCNVR